MLIPFTIILSASLLTRSCCPAFLPHTPLGNLSRPTASASVPELVARGVIHQMFPLHEQRILNQLMTSWVQAVCERQPLGKKHTTVGLHDTAFLTRLNKIAPYYSADDICDYFGVKISMYFAWLGFYTNSMLYPAVIGFLLWILAESDQVLGTIVTVSGLLRWCKKRERFDLHHDHACVSLPDQSGHLLRGFCPL